MEDTVNKLEAMFNKAESDIDYVSRKVDAECENMTEETNQVNPAEIMKRLGDIKSEYAGIVKEAQAIQEAQKEAMVFFKDQLTGLCTALSQLQHNTGLANGEKPPELQQFESFIGVQIPSTASASGDSPDGTSSESDKAYTIKQPVPVVNNGETASTDMGACANTPDFLEPELSAFDRRAKSKECIEIDTKEFNSVSSLIRGRAKLTEVNQTYRILWTHFKEEGNSEPLGTAQMYKMGLRITGQTGEAKLKVLRALKLINISKKGDVTML